MFVREEGPIFSTCLTSGFMLACSTVDPSSYPRLQGLLKTQKPVFGLSILGYCWTLTLTGFYLCQVMLNCLQWNHRNPFTSCTPMDHHLIKSIKLYTWREGNTNRDEDLKAHVRHVSVITLMSLKLTYQYFQGCFICEEHWQLQYFSMIPLLTMRCLAQAPPNTCVECTNIRGDNLIPSNYYNTFINLDKNIIY